MKKSNREMKNKNEDNYKLNKLKEDVNKRESQEKDKSKNSTFNNKLTDLFNKFKSNSIKLHIRFPTGKEITQTFEMFRKVEFVKNYILKLKNKGICDALDEMDDDPYAFYIVWGIPPKVLDENKTLQNCFGETEEEYVTVEMTN